MKEFSIKTSHTRGILKSIVAIFLFMFFAILIGATSNVAYAQSDFYIYGARVYTEVNSTNTYNMVLYTSDGSSGTWSKSNTVDGEYTTIGTGVSIDLGEEENDLSGWYKCNNSEPIHLIEKVLVDELHGDYTLGGINLSGSIYNGKWFITDQNEHMAYLVNQGKEWTCFDVVAKYDVPEKQDESYPDGFAGQTVWMISAANSWYLYTSKVAHPEALSEDERKAYHKTDVKIRITSMGVNVNVQLAADERALSVTNTYITPGGYALMRPVYGPEFDGGGDACTYAILNEDSSLKYLYYIAAPSTTSQNLIDVSPAFTISSDAKVDLLGLGRNSDYYNPFVMAKKSIGHDDHYRYNTFNNVGDVIVSIVDKGGGFSFSWIDRNPGDVISFTINGGSVSGMPQFTTPEKVIDLINGFANNIEYTEECRNKIDAARTAYECLSESDKALVTNYANLTSAEKAYDAMDKINAIGTIANTPESKALVDAAKNFYDGLDSDTQALVLSDFVTTLNDDVAIMNAITKINEIGDLDESDECWDRIMEAISAYVSLNTDQKGMFPTDTYNTFNDKYSAKVVIDKIKEIGDVEYSSESKGKIDAALELFNDLTDGQQALVVNKDKLIQANTDYNAVDAVVGLINLIPSEFDYSDEYKEKIDAARTAYDKLTPYQKSIIPSEIFGKLDNGEKLYNVIDLINNIGKVEYTQSCKEKIDAARNAYDALTTEQKALVTNYKTLTDAEAAYAGLAPTPTPDPSKDSKKIVDEETGVTVETSDGKNIPTNITLNVKLNTKVVEKNYENIAKILDKQRISRVYDIKLIQTIDGVEKEIQPSDIEPGTKIIIRIAVPKGINSSKAKIVHVHNDIAKFVENLKVENNEFVFEVAELSDFAIVTPKTGFITESHGFCVGWVVFIFAIVLLVYLALYILIHFGLCNSLIKALKLDGLKNVLKLLGIINVAASGAICVFALVTLILHACPISLVSFIIVALATITFTTLFILTLKKGKTNEIKEGTE